MKPSSAVLFLTFPLHLSSLEDMITRKSPVVGLDHKGCTNKEPLLYKRYSPTPLKEHYAW